MANQKEAWSLIGKKACLMAIKGNEQFSNFLRSNKGQRLYVTDPPHKKYAFLFQATQNRSTWCKEVPKRVESRPPSMPPTRSEQKERPYICFHAKKDKHETHATSSFEAAKNAAAQWGMKSTAGITAKLADVPEPNPTHPTPRPQPGDATPFSHFFFKPPIQPASRTGAPSTVPNEPSIDRLQDPRARRGTSSGTAVPGEIVVQSRVGPDPFAPASSSNRDVAAGLGTPVSQLDFAIWDRAPARTGIGAAHPLQSQGRQQARPGSRNPPASTGQRTRHPSMPPASTGQRTRHPSMPPAVHTSTGQRTRHPSMPPAVHTHNSASASASASASHASATQPAKPLKSILKKRMRPAPSPERDADVVMDSCVVSLHCPTLLGYLKRPVRGVSCRHPQCFDQDNFAALVRQNRGVFKKKMQRCLRKGMKVSSEPKTLKCPVCPEQIVTKDLSISLKVAPQMVRILHQVKDRGLDIDSVKCRVSGASWTIIEASVVAGVGNNADAAASTAGKKASAGKPKSSKTAVITIDETDSGSDAEGDMLQSGRKQHKPNPKPKTKTRTLATTNSSSSDAPSDSSDDELIVNAHHRKRKQRDVLVASLPAGSSAGTSTTNDTRTSASSSPRNASTGGVRDSATLATGSRADEDSARHGPGVTDADFASSDTGSSARSDAGSADESEDGEVLWEVDRVVGHEPSTATSWAQWRVLWRMPGVPPAKDNHIPELTDTNSTWETLEKFVQNDEVTEALVDFEMKRTGPVASREAVAKRLVKEMDFILEWNKANAFP